MQRLLLVIGLTLLCAGCQYNPDTNEYCDTIETPVGPIYGCIPAPPPPAPVGS